MDSVRIRENNINNVATCLTLRLHIHCDRTPPLYCEVYIRWMGMCHRCPNRNCLSSNYVALSDLSPHISSAVSPHTICSEQHPSMWCCCTVTQYHFDGGSWPRFPADSMLVLETLEYRQDPLPAIQLLKYNGR